MKRPLFISHVIEFFTAYKKNKELEDELQELKWQIEVLEGELQDAESDEDADSLAVRAVSKLLGKRVSYMDYRALPIHMNEKYMEDAEHLSTNSVIDNEMLYFKDHWVKEALSQASNFEDVQRIRWSLVGMDLLVERIQGINVNTVSAPTQTKDGIFKGV